MDSHPPFSSDGDGRHPTPRDILPEPGHRPARDVAGEPSRSACPICGALGLPGDGHTLALDGQSHEALDLWIAHCAARNIALQVAASALAANAALARALAARSHARGEFDAAARIEAEARFEAQCYAQMHQMLEGLETGDPTPA